MPAWLNNLYLALPVWPFAAAALVVAVLLIPPAMAMGAWRPCWPWCRGRGRTWRWGTVRTTRPIATQVQPGDGPAAYGGAESSAPRLPDPPRAIFRPAKRAWAFWTDSRWFSPGKMYLEPYSPAAGPTELRAVVSSMSQHDLRLRRVALAEYRTTHGRFPQNEQELAERWEPGTSGTRWTPKGWQPRRRSGFAIAADGELYMLASGGVLLSPGHLPYLYENARTCRPGPQGPSRRCPARRQVHHFAWRRAFTCFSAEAWDSAVEFDRGWWEVYLPCLVGAGVVAPPPSCCSFRWLGCVA